MQIFPLEAKLVQDEVLHSNNGTDKEGQLIKSVKTHLRNLQCNLQARKQEKGFKQDSDMIRFTLKRTSID